MAGSALKDSSNSVSYQGAPASSKTISLTTAAVNRLAMIFVKCPGTTVSGISGGGTWTRQNNGQAGYELWTSPFATQQTGVTLTVSLAGSISTIDIILDTFSQSGNAAIPTFDTSNATTFATSTTPAGSVTTGTTNTTIVAWVYGSGSAGNSLVAGTGYTQDAAGVSETGGSSFFIGELANADTAGSGVTVTPGFTFGNNSSGVIIAASIKAAPPAPTAPSAPTINTITTTGFNVNPGALTSNASSLNIQVTLASDPTFATPAVTITGATASANNAITGLTPGTAYIARTVAVGTGGSTNGTATASTPTLCSAPTGLVVANVAQSLSMSLSWVAATGATTYDVLRSTTNGSGYATFGGSTGIGGTTFTDTTGSANTNYYYVIRAVNASGNSANSSQGTGISLTPPAAPSGVTATAGNSNVSIAFTNPSGAVKINIYRSLSIGSGYALLPAGTGYTAASPFVDNTAANGTTYYYELSAVNVAGVEGPLTSTTGAENPQTCPPPTSLTATLHAGIGVDLAWVAPAGFVGTGYNIYKSTGATTNGVSHRHNGQPYAQVPWGTTTYTDRSIGYPPPVTGGNVASYYVTTVALNNNLLTVTGSPTGGTFIPTITVNGLAAPTAGIAYNSSAAAFKTALEALPGIGTGNIQVTGSNGGPWTISGINRLANVVITISINAAGLTGGSTPGVSVTPSNNGLIESAASNIPGSVTFVG